MGRGGEVMTERCANGYEIQTVLGMRVCVCFDADKGHDNNGSIAGPTYRAPPCGHDDEHTEGDDENS